MGAMYLHARTFFALADTTSVPLGAMYLHARKFCALAHTTSIPVGEMYLYMQERSVHSLIRLLYPWVWCIYMQNLLNTRSYDFYTHGCDVFTCKNVLYTCSCKLYTCMCNVFTCKNILALSDLILYPLGSKLFTVISEVWSLANWAVVTNNLTMIVEVMLIDVILIEGFL